MIGPLAAGDGVLKAGIESAKVRRRKSRADIKELWELQDDFADTVDLAWQKAMGSAVKQFARSSFKTAANVNDGLRRLDQIAVRFGRSKSLEGYSDEMLRGAYATGILFVYDRWEDLKKGRTASPKGDGLREPAEKAKPDSTDIVVNVSFTQADEAALAELSDETMVWFRDRSGAVYYDPAARKEITRQAGVMIREGASQLEIAEAMREAAEALYGVGAFANRGRSYWGGVAEHMATTAGVRGQLTELTELGFTRYELINPSDERTTEICQVMNGKVVIVEDANTHNARLATAKTPDEVKAIHPFAPGGSTKLVDGALGRSLSVGSGVLSPRDSATLGKAGVAVPPFHFRCRTFLDVYYDGPGAVPPLASSPSPPDKR